MQKHLLVTVSEKKSALYGVRFVGHFFSNKDSIKVTLFYTAPKPPSVWEGEKTLEGEHQREQQTKEQETKGRRALEEAKKTLGMMGFHQDQLETKLIVRKTSKVDEIIREGSEGLYDAVVLGRRGLSRFEEAFDESVSRKLLEEKCNFPVWVCRRPDLERKNVLICVDGSDAAYCIVDHAGYILRQEPHHKITLLSVTRKGKVSDATADEIISKCKEILLNHEFPEERTRIKVIDDTNAAKAIMKEAEQGRYAAVATGRTGAGAGLLKKIFMGSVSHTLFRELEKSTLWTCQ
ncbi:MAG: universal stress protein [Thermodesulfobacteriota bacterium]